MTPSVPPRRSELRSELPWLALWAALLVVLLHANAPEVWFWFTAQLLLLLWRTLAWRSRRWERRQAQQQLEGQATQPEQAH